MRYFNILNSLTELSIFPPLLSDKIKYLTMTDSTKVWMPDTFFRNEKIGRFHDILQPNLYVRVFPNGDVLYSIRSIIETIRCEDDHHVLEPFQLRNVL